MKGGLSRFGGRPRVRDVFFFFPVSIAGASKPRLGIRCRTLLVAEQPGRRGTGERRANPGWHAVTGSVAR